MTHFESRDLLDHFRQEAIVTEQHTTHIELRTYRSQGRRQVQVETRWIRDKIIGSGAFGDVWLESRQKEDAVRAMRAVKVISKHRMQDCNIDYKKELLALAKFSKRSYQQEDVLVEFFGWFEDALHLFISMEYFELGDLSQHITDSLSDEDSRQITIDLLHGLRIIHKEKFAHRDLKPKNIFVVQKPPAPCWWVKIGDFGISKRAYGETELHTQIGSALYKAPEISGYYESAELLSGYDQAVDMWSLGCVVYEILTQNVPFADSLAILKFCDGRNSFPEENILYKVGPEGVAFIMSLIKANPKHRLTADDALKSQWIIQENKPKPLLPDLQDLILEDKESWLWKAIKTGDLRTVQRLLGQGVKVAELLIRRGASLEPFNDHGYGPWHSAVMNSHLEILRLFVRERLDPCAVNLDGETPLGCATMRDRLELAKFLLDSGARIHGVYGKHRECCLNIAVLTGNLRLTRLFLQGVPGSVSRSCRINALILAAAFSRSEEFHLLTETIGCDVKNEDGLTPLIVAAALDQREMVEYLLLGTHLNDVVVSRPRSTISVDNIPCVHLLRTILIDREVTHLFANFEPNISTPINTNGLTSLIAACQTGKLWIVQLLLQHGADPNVANHLGVTPLRQAIIRGHTDIVQLLLEMGSDPNAPDSQGSTPLHCAAHGSSVEILEALVESGATLQSDSLDRDVLHVYAQKGHTEALKFLLDKFKQPVSASNKYGVTLLHTAASDGMLDTVKFLVGKGANVNAASLDQWTPLHNAAEKGQLAVADFLISNGANVNVASDSWITPLHDAALQGQVEMIELLLDKGAKLDPLNLEKETPLYLAIYHDHSEAARLLLERGSSFTVRTKENKIALEYAISAGRIEISRLLLNKGAGDHFYTYTHLTPLMYSFQFPDLERKMVTFLIDQEVNHNLLSGDGKTALHRAALWGNTNAVKHLLKKGAHSNAFLSGYSSSPLYHAADGRHVKMVQLLLDAGAHDTTHNMATLNVALHKGPPKIVELLLLDGRVEVNADISESGLKPLHKASFLGNVEAVRSLLSAGADIHAADSSGYSALHHAVQYNRSKIVKVLLEFCADAKRKSKNGASPLDLAAQSGREASANVFEEYGFVLERPYSLREKSTMLMAEVAHTPSLI
ncbi:unnamed protein product [Penicillium pancosmium]